MSPVRNRIAAMVAAGTLAGGGWLAWAPGEELNCGCLAYQPTPTEACIEWAEVEVTYLSTLMPRLDKCLLRRDRRNKGLGLYGNR